MKNFWPNIAVGAVFLLAPVLWFPRLPAHFFSGLPSPPFQDNEFAALSDPYAFLWNLWWFREALSSGQSPFFTPLLRAPEGLPLGLHSLSSGNGLVAYPLQTFFPLTGVYNLLLLLSFTLSGLAAYGLARELGLGRVGAVAAGLLFAFTPQRLIRARFHLNLVSTQWLVFAIWGFARLSDGRRHWKSAWWAGPALALAVASCWYWGPYFLLFAGVWWGWQGWARLSFWWRTMPVTGSAVRKWPEEFLPWKALLMRWLLAGGVAAVLLSPVLWAAARDLREGGTVIQSALDADLYAPDFACLLLPPFTSFWAGSWTDSLLTGWKVDRIETGVSMGFLVLLLAFLGFRWKQGPRLPGWALLLGLGALVLSFGPTLHVAGIQTGVPLPYRLWNSLPLLSGARIPGRLALLTALAVACFAGRGVERLWTGKGKGLAFLLLALALLENADGRLGFLDTAQAQALASLGKEEVKGLWLDLPGGSDWREDLLSQTAHRHSLVTAFHARPVPGMDSVLTANPALRFLNTGEGPPPGPEETLATLQTLGVEWVALHHRSEGHWRSIGGLFDAWNWKAEMVIPSSLRLFQVPGTPPDLGEAPAWTGVYLSGWGPQEFRSDLNRSFHWSLGKRQRLMLGWNNITGAASPGSAGAPPILSQRGRGVEPAGRQRYPSGMDWFLRLEVMPLASLDGTPLHIKASWNGEALGEVTLRDAMEVQHPAWRLPKHPGPEGRAMITFEPSWTVRPADHPLFRNEDQRPLAYQMLSVAVMMLP